MGPSHVSERIDSWLVVGGGAVAARAIATLLEAGTRVTVVSPWLAPALLEVAREGRLSWWPREYACGDVSGFARVVAATDDAEVNARVLAEAAERGLPENPAAAAPIAATVAERRQRS
jgi:siroheme synthase-like protein